MSELLIILRTRDDIQYLQPHSNMIHFTSLKAGGRGSSDGLTSKILEKDQTMEGLVTNTLTSQLNIKFNGHERYILELHPKS